MKLLRPFLFLCVAMAGIGTQAQDYAFTPLDVTAEQGSQAELSISMTNNSLAVISAQFDLILPEGITVAKNAKGAPICSLVGSRIDDHIVQAAVQADGVVRFLTYSPTNLAYLDTDGPLVTTLLDINVEPGTYTVKLANGSLTHENDFVEYFTPDVTATITVTAPEIKRYGNDQMYVKDIAINQGENTTLMVGYNITSDLFAYSTDIQLPVGASVESVEFGDAVKVANYTNVWNVEGKTLTLMGEYGGGRKDEPAGAGDFIFATIELNTSAVAPGNYTIIVDNQYLDTDNGEISPEPYEAYMTVAGSTNPNLEPCATPTISFDSDGNLIVTSTTAGATMHTTINAVDHGTVHHANDEMIALTGQYLISAYASAVNMADSAPATAVLVWAKGAEASGVDNISAGTERALLIRSANDNIEIVGTLEGEKVALYTLSGTVLYEGVASATVTTIPVGVTSGNVYIISVGTQSFKYKF